MESNKALEAKLVVDEWNAHQRIGQAVRVLLDDASFRKSKTRSEAWVASGQPLVLVEGICGGYSLYRVVPDWREGG
jgi:hypothetical protein